jgi:hypothetical protein
MNYRSTLKERRTVILTPRDNKYDSVEEAGFLDVALNQSFGRNARIELMPGEIKRFKVTLDGEVPSIVSGAYHDEIDRGQYDQKPKRGLIPSIGRYLKGLKETKPTTVVDIPDGETIYGNGKVWDVNPPKRKR